MSEHSVIGASSMSRWVACPGSVRLSKNAPEQKSPYAEEGTRAHELAEKALLNERGWKKMARENPEMWDAVKIYVDYVNALRSEKGSKWWIEKRLTLHSVDGNAFGTADFLHVNYKKGCLSTVDYKHGAGVYVEIEDNLQLQYYAYGAYESIAFDPRIKTVKIAIVQPRCIPDEPIREATFGADELMDFGVFLYDAVAKTKEKNAPIVPGGHCRWCPAHVFCPKIKEQAQAVAKSQFAEVHQYDAKALAEALKWAPRLIEWAKKVNEFAYNEAMSGRCPPGFKLVEKRATRKWNNIKDAEDYFSTVYGEEAFNPPQLKSPAQLEKVVGKKQVAAFCSKVSSGMKLVAESEKGEAIEIADAKEVFK